MEYIFSVKVL